MKMNNQKYYIQILISLIGLCIGYPYGGTVFIALMIPFVAMMVLSKDINYLPALMVHMASETSIYTVILLLMMIVVIRENKILTDKYVRRIYKTLLFLLPVYLLIIYQQIVFGGNNIQKAFASFGIFYLVLWSFTFTYIIGNRFNNYSLKLLLFTLITVKILTLLNICEYSRISGCVNYFIPAYGIYYCFRGQRPLGLFCLLISLPALLTDEDLTFSIFGATLLAILITYCFVKNRVKSLQILTGLSVFVAIIALLLYGSFNYQGMIVNSSEHMDFSSWSAFSDRFMFKLFGDRAPFWNSGIMQILTYHPLFPDPHLPEIFAVAVDGHEIDNSVYGSHNIFIEYVRLFGIIPGVILCCLIIAISQLGRKYIISANSCNNDMPIFISSISSFFILCLTGTLTVQPSYALYTVGLMGVAYAKYKTLK